MNNKPTLIDTHCHLNSQEYRANIPEFLQRANDSGVSRFVIVGCDLNDSIEAVNLCEKYSDAKHELYASIGIHPHDAKNFPQIPSEFHEQAANQYTIAIGEIGLDFHYDNSPREIQVILFRKQLDFANELDKPVILHIRDAFRESWEILREGKYSNLKLLFHCYSGGLEYLDEICSRENTLCALGGAVTWKNSSELHEIAKRIPLEKLVLETDCPYMTPAPFRGKINEPSYVKLVYEKISELRNISLEDLAAKINLNFQKFFFSNNTITQ